MSNPNLQYLRAFLSGFLFYSLVISEYAILFGYNIRLTYVKILNKS